MAKMEKTNTIIRTSKRENPYVMIDKYGLNDERLSWKAKGLLAYLLSKPDDWQVYESDLIKRASDGRDSVRTGLRELQKFGYISRKQIRGENGSFAHMEYTVYERPITIDDTEKTTADGKSVHGELPQTENPSTGNPTTGNPLLLINDFTNNDLKDDCLIEASAEIAAAHAESSAALESSQQNEIYEALRKYIPKYVYLDGIPAVSYLDDIFLMLVRQFPNQLDPEVIKLAANRYFDRSAENAPGAPNGIIMKLDVKNPVGLYQICYKEAIQLYKAQNSKKRTYL